MTQEIRVQLQLVMEVDSSYSKEEIERRINIMLDKSKDNFSSPDLDLKRAEILYIEEEDEIYGNEEESPEMEEYYRKYGIDRKRQTRLDL